MDRKVHQDKVNIKKHLAHVFNLSSVDDIAFDTVVNDKFMFSFKKNLNDCDSEAMIASMEKDPGSYEALTLKSISKVMIGDNYVISIYFVDQNSRQSLIRSSSTASDRSVLGMAWAFISMIFSIIPFVFGLFGAKRTINRSESSQKSTFVRIFAVLLTAFTLITGLLFMASCYFSKRPGCVSNFRINTLELLGRFSSSSATNGGDSS